MNVILSNRQIGTPTVSCKASALVARLSGSDIACWRLQLRFRCFSVFLHLAYFLSTSRITLQARQPMSALGRSREPARLPAPTWMIVMIREGLKEAGWVIVGKCAAISGLWANRSYTRYTCERKKVSVLRLGKLAAQMTLSTWSNDRKSEESERAGYQTI